MRKIAVAALSVLALTASVSAICALPQTSAQAATKEIGLYLIAGQSNATGYSNVASVSSKNNKAIYTSGFDNVYYRGRGDGNYVDAYNYKVKYGLGWTGSSRVCFGAEIGMADVISSYDPDGENIIVKYAQGAAYLYDNTTASVSKSHGNFCPPSKRSDSSVGGISGKLYDGLVDTIAETVEYYEEKGYTVTLKGTFWMQGEAETGSTLEYNAYESYLTAFISDLRAECEKFDENAGFAPFVIGKIASTFNGGGNGVVAVRAAEDAVAEKVSNVYCVETEDCIIVDPTTGEPGTGCYDRYHFNGDDMLWLGKEAAKKMFVGNEPHVVVKATGEGTADKYYAVLNGDVTFTFTPKAHYFLTLYKNGVDVTADVVNGRYVMTETTGVHELKAVFTEETKYALTIVNDQTKGTVTKYTFEAGTSYYAGVSFTLGVATKDGNAVKKVTFNGVELTANAQGRYEITVVAGENIFAVEYEDGATSSAPDASDDSSVSGGQQSPSGCGARLSLGAVGALLLLALAAWKRKGKNP